MNMHNEGAKPARSWQDSNRPGLARELGREYSWMREALAGAVDTMTTRQVWNSAGTSRALAFFLAMMKTSAF